MLGWIIPREMGSPFTMAKIKRNPPSASNSFVNNYSAKPTPTSKQNSQQKFTGSSRRAGDSEALRLRLPVQHEFPELAPATNPFFDYRPYSGFEPWPTLGKVRIDRNFPRIKQPFGYVATVPVGLAPRSQAIRVGVGLPSESQLPDLQFKLIWNRWRGFERSPTAPVRISASASHSVPCVRQTAFVMKG